MKRKTEVNNAFAIIICIIMFVSSLLLGAPIKYNTLIINLAVIIIGIVYLIIKYIKKETKLISNPLDIFVVLICLSTTIPIIFNTYANLQDSIIYVLKYFTGMVIYFIVKDLCKDKKYINYFVNTIIFSGVVISLLGIDNITNDYFYNIGKSIGLPYVINYEDRMFSIFGYANSFAIFIAICLILALNKYVQEKDDILSKVYGTIIPLFLSCIILSYSKATMLVFALFIILNVLLLKDRNKRIKYIFSFILTLIISSIYVMLWSGFMYNKCYLEIWLCTGGLIVVSYFAFMILEKLVEKLEKISNKTYSIIVTTIVILILLFIGIGLNLSKPLVLFENDTSEVGVFYRYIAIKPNSKYVLDFDIEAKSKLQEETAYRIRVAEEDKYHNEIISHEVEVNNFTGKKQIEFYSGEKTETITIEFKSKYKIAQEYFKINSLYINDKQYILNYLYLPTKLVHKIQDINFSHKTVWERMVFYEDSLKIIQNNFIFGLGGNGWRYSYEDVRQYKYFTTEVHSYPLQVFVEYGIVGFISLIGILLFLIILSKRKISEDGEIYLGIIIATFTLIIHSFVDFEMSYLYIMMLWFMLIGIISSGKKE